MLSCAGNHRRAVEGMSTCPQPSAAGARPRAVALGGRAPALGCCLAAGGAPSPRRCQRDGFSGRRARGRREQTCWQREPLREAAPVTGRRPKPLSSLVSPYSHVQSIYTSSPAFSCVCSYTAGLRCQESQPLVAPSVTSLPSEQDRKSASRHCSSLRPLTQCRDRRMQVESLILLPPSE